MDQVIGDEPNPGQAVRTLVPSRCGRPQRVQEELQLTTGDGEPASFAEAGQDEAWRSAMRDEIASIKENRTWELTKLPSRHHAIGLRWVFKQKKDESGAVIKYKAWLVAKGYVQQAGVDFEEVFAPVARMESMRLIMALAADEG
jgi:hypothetical protein